MLLMLVFAELVSHRCRSVVHFADAAEIDDHCTCCGFWRTDAHHQQWYYVLSANWVKSQSPVMLKYTFWVKKLKDDYELQGHGGW